MTCPLRARRAELQGFIAPKGKPGYVDYVITDDKLGLKYNEGEKSYRMIEGLNFIIANAKRKIPDFGLTGSMRANTELPPYVWDIRIGKDGWAKQVPIRAPLPQRAANAVRTAFKEARALLSKIIELRTALEMRGVDAAIKAAKAAAASPPDSAEAQKPLEKFKKHLARLPCGEPRDAACINAYDGSPSGSPLEQYAYSLLASDYQRWSRTGVQPPPGSNRL